MELTVRGINEIVLDFKTKPASVNRALPRAINRSLASGRTVIVRGIARDTGLKASDVRAALRLTEATTARPVGRLAADLKRIPLIKFRARGPEPSRGKGKGVTYRIGARAGHVATAFIATMASGHRGVYKRTTTSRLPIVELQGPSLGHVFKTFRPAGLARIAEVLAKNFDHELKYESTGGTGGVSSGD